jgi:hypothetical protein
MVEGILMKLLRLKILLISIFSLIPNALFADSDFLVLDRRSFITKPNRTCSILIVDQKAIHTSCSSIGFETNTLEDVDNNRSDFIYFIHFPEIKTAKTILNKESFLTVIYFDNEKIIALTPSSKITDEKIIFLENLKSTDLKNHIAKLETEFTNLNNSYLQAEKDLQSKMSQINNDPQINKKLQERTELKAQLLRNNFISEEIKYMQSRNKSARKIESTNPPSTMKALLSTQLKNSIENDLKTKN